jgi:hypothetical protein
MKKMIIGKEIIRDVAQGVSQVRLMRKYGLTRGQLRAVLHQLSDIRQRRVESMVIDIKSGLGLSIFAQKYQLSVQATFDTLKQLVDEGAVSKGEVAALFERDNAALMGDRFRTAERNYPTLMVSVVDVGNNGDLYVVRDISEKGLRVDGIKANVGEIKNLAVVGDALGQIVPFELEAECRWVGYVDPGGERCAGFRITHISDEDLVRLRRFILEWTLAI